MRTQLCVGQNVTTKDTKYIERLFALRTYLWWFGSIPSLLCFNTNRHLLEYGAVDSLIKAIQ